MSTLFSISGHGAGTYTPPPSRIVSGSIQQDRIWDHLVNSASHMVVEARAGTGKSSTCREGMHRLIESDRSLSGKISYVAFNKSIADEFQSGLPSGAKATTMHSAGYAAIRQEFPWIDSPNKNKLRGIADSLFTARDRGSRKTKTASIRLADQCKGRLIDGSNPKDVLRIAALQGIDIKGREEAVSELVPRIIAESLRQTSHIDFADMVWMPVMLGLDFAPCEVLFVDECQDLDPCQHAMVSLMAGEGRMIAVGDSRQAIYGFRGADARSMATLAAMLESDAKGVDRLPLTATRRCPTSHVELARKIVPDFESLPDAKRGRWEQNAEAASVLEPGWMVLCRKNAPLVSLAFQTAARNVPVSIQGKDLGEGLARFIEDFESTTINDLSREVSRYRAAQLERLAEIDDAEEEIASVNDRCDCVQAIAPKCPTIGNLVEKVRSLFREVSRAEQRECVLFSSVHRAKGREAEKVAILDPSSMPSPWARSEEAIEQEMNLIYVAATRSKHRLAFLGPIPQPLDGAF